MRVTPRVRLQPQAMSAAVRAQKVADCYEDLAALAKASSIPDPQLRARSLATVLRQEFKRFATRAEPVVAHAELKLSEGRVAELAFLHTVAIAEGIKCGNYGVLLAAHTVLGNRELVRQTRKAAQRAGKGGVELEVFAARVLVLAAQGSAAMELLEPVLAEHPDHPAAQEYLAMCLIGTEREGESLRTIRRLQRSGHPVSARAHGCVATALKGRDENQEALLWFLQAAQLDEREAYFPAGAAGCFADLGDQQGFTTQLDRALQLPLGVSHYCILVLSADQLGDRDALLKLHQAASRDGLRDSLVSGLLAEALRAVGEASLAREYFAAYLEQQPHDTAVVLVLTDLLNDANDPAAALDCLLQASKTCPDAPELWRATAEQLLRDPTAANRQRATALLTKFVRVDPNDAPARLLLADTLLAMRKYIEAANAYSNAARRSKGDTRALWRAAADAYACAKRNRQRHIEALQELLAADPTDVRSKGELGQLLMDAGKKREGSEMLAEVERLKLVQRLALEHMTPVVAEPTAADRQPQRVHTLRASFRQQGKSVEGQVLGSAWDGRQVVRTAGGDVWWAPFSGVAISGAHEGGALASVPRAHQYHPSAAQEATLRDLLNRPECGTVTPLQLHEAFTRNGHDSCFVTGGVLARMLAGEPVDAHADVDLVTTLLPQPVRYVGARLCAGLAGLGDSGVRSTADTRFRGVVSFGGPPITSGQSGIDVATLRQHGMYAPRQEVLGNRGKVFPLAFGDDLVADAMARDFTCNAIYYDPNSGRLLDPTGHGVADAMNKTLRLTCGANIDLNDALALRFGKMLQRGWHADAALRDGMRRNAELFWAASDSRALVRNLARMVPKNGGPIDESGVRAWLEGFVRTLHEAGLGDLADAHLLPLADFVVLRCMERQSLAHVQPGLGS